MKRRVFLASALALPFLALLKVRSGKVRRVQVTFPLIFREGDARSYVREGRLQTPIGDKMQRAVKSVLASNPQLSPDMTRKVSFDLRKDNGEPWGRPGAVTLPSTAVFKKDSPWTAPRNAIMAKGLWPAMYIASKDSPAIKDLSRVIVKATFKVART